MLNYRKALIIIVIFSMIILPSCNKTKKINTSYDLSTNSIQSITLSTQMIDKPPGRIMIENENDIKLIIETIKKLEYIPNESKDSSKGWLFLLYIEYKNNEIMQISFTKKNVNINGKEYETTNDISDELFEVYKTLVK